MDVQLQDNIIGPSSLTNSQACENLECMVQCPFTSTGHFLARKSHFVCRCCATQSPFALNYTVIGLSKFVTVPPGKPKRKEHWCWAVSRCCLSTGNRSQCVCVCFFFSAKLVLSEWNQCYLSVIWAMYVGSSLSVFCWLVTFDVYLLSELVRNKKKGNQALTFLSRRLYEKKNPMKKITIYYYAWAMGYWINGRRLEDDHWKIYDSH